MLARFDVCCLEIIIKMNLVLGSFFGVDGLQSCSNSGHTLDYNIACAADTIYAILTIISVMLAVLFCGLVSSALRNLSSHVVFSQT